LPGTSPVYRPRKPQESQYYQCVEDNFETLEQVYDERFATRYGFFRPYEEKTFDALEWLAAMCSHVPNKGEQMARYYGYYSNVSRGKRKKEDNDELTPSILEPDGNAGRQAALCGPGLSGCFPFLILKKNWVNGLGYPNLRHFQHCRRHSTASDPHHIQARPELRPQFSSSPF
jgi:hypothetical protein